MYEYPYFVRQRSAHLQYSKYQSQIFCTIKPNNCKNLMFDTVASFYWTIEYFWFFSLAKIMSLVCFTCSFRTSFHVRDIIFICILVTYDDWKINDLSDILNPDNTLGENSCIVHSLIIAVCVRGHVAFNANDIYRCIWFVPLLRIQRSTRFDENPNIVIQYYLVKFTR